MSTTTETGCKTKYCEEVEKTKRERESKKRVGRFARLVRTGNCRRFPLRQRGKQSETPTLKAVVGLAYQVQRFYLVVENRNVPQNCDELKGGPAAVGSVVRVAVGTERAAGFGEEELTALTSGSNIEHMREIPMWKKMNTFSFPRGGS